MAEAKYGVWRLRRSGTWRLLHTFKNRETAKKKAEDLRRQIMTVRWGKVR